jgi:hypothetical protein
MGLREAQQTARQNAEHLAIFKRLLFENFSF